MKLDLSRTAAALSLAIATGNAHAVLTSANTLSIANDAVMAYPTTSSAVAYVSSDGPLLDSFFTIFGSPLKSTVESQYAYLYNGASLTLNGSPQSNMATYSFYYAPGSFKTLGTGLSILSASGDTATVNMSGWTASWNSVPNITLGTLAWSSGYTSGVGNLTCTSGSGCAVGSAYTLTYTAAIPAGDPSGLGGTQFYLELHGTVGAVPEASTYAMMLTGLGMVAVAARRRKTCSAA